MIFQVTKLNDPKRLQFEKHLESKLPKTLHKVRREQAKELGCQIGEKKSTQQTQHEAELVRRIKGTHLTASDTIQDFELAQLAELHQERKKEVEESKRRQMIQFFTEHVEKQKKQRAEATDQPKLDKPEQTASK